MRGYSRLTIPCVCLLIFPLVSYWRINREEEHLNRWEPRINEEFGQEETERRKKIATNEAINSQIPIVLDHETALSLITESGFTLEMDFEQFDNQVGADRFIVPNIVHYLRLKLDRFTFTDYLCLISAFINQKPNFIIIHTDVLNSGGFKGNAVSILLPLIEGFKCLLIL